MLYKYLDPRVDDLAYVQQLRQNCLALILQGKTLMSYSAEGSSGTKQALIPISDLLQETKFFIRDATGNYPVDATITFFS